jgi:hypothetical protein
MTQAPEHRQKAVEKEILVKVEQSTSWFIDLKKIPRSSENFLFAAEGIRKLSDLISLRECEQKPR